MINQSINQSIYDILEPTKSRQANDKHVDVAWVSTFVQSQQASGPPTF
jgi:hypothetical protein